MLTLTIRAATWEMVPSKMSTQRKIRSALDALQSFFPCGQNARMLMVFWVLPLRLIFLNIHFTNRWCVYKLLDAWQTEQILIRQGGMWRLIWIYTVCAGLIVSVLRVIQYLLFLWHCTLLRYEGESIKKQPNLFLGEIDLFFFFCYCTFLC